MLGEKWFKDPDGTHKETYDSAAKAFKDGVISDAELQMIRRTADQCRDEAKRENAK